MVTVMFVAEEEREKVTVPDRLLPVVDETFVAREKNRKKKKCITHPANCIFGVLSPNDNE